MKRKRVAIAERLIQDVMRLSGAVSPSRAVELALEDFVRRAKVRRILELRGSGLWEGDLSEMRDSRATRSTPRRRA